MEDESAHIPLGSPCMKMSNSNSNYNNSNKEQDRFLPIANVGRIMKKVIPGNAKISKDAKAIVKECVSEFISFVTGEASDKCRREKRKTINGDDIIWAITTLGFEDYVGPLRLYLNRYREMEGGKMNVPEQQQISQGMKHQQQQLIISSEHEQNTFIGNFDTSNHHHHHHHHHVYSSSSSSAYSTTLLSHQPDSFDYQQPFSLPFSPTSIQRQLQQEDRFDSVGHW